MRHLLIASIVEGHGEIEAVPALLRRCGEGLGWAGRVVALPPIRQPASKLLCPNQLERVVEIAARKLNGPGGIMVLLDCDDACPAKLGPEILARVRKARSDLPTTVILANREYEAWFLAAARSIAGRRGLSPGLQPAPLPESVRGCKEWLSNHMETRRAYNEVEDQPALTTIFDFDAARHGCPSFDKCHREITSLLANVARITPGFGA